MITRSVISFLAILIWVTVQAQTVVLPDTNFRNKLLQDYPQVMSGLELDIAQAQAVSGWIDLSWGGIVDLSGAENFSSMTAINLANNSITDLSPLNQVTGMRHIIANHNDLSGVTDLSAFTSLTEFQAMHNSLDALPTFAASAEIEQLYVSDNNIAVFPSLSAFPKMRELVIGDNPFRNVLDYSLCPDLTQLHVHQLELDSIQGLGTLDKLEILYAWENNITDFEGLSSNTVLEECYMNNNLASVLPDFSNKPNLDILIVKQCKLSFDDLAGVQGVSNLSVFSYAPQKNMSFDDISLREFQTLLLESPSDLVHSLNVYQWTQINGDVSYDATWVTSEVNQTHAGEYVLKVTNPDFSGLTLVTDTFEVEVLPCLEIEDEGPGIASSSCESAYTLDFASMSVLGGTQPFTYILDDGVDQSAHVSSSVDSVSAGEKALIIEDANACRDTVTFALDRIKGCDPVITPNGDGVADSYYIEYQGEVKVYDASRQQITILNGPVAWDGTTQNGSPLDAGYYILVDDSGDALYVTIVR